MVLSGGENIYPQEVEDVLNEHPDVREAVIVGEEDERWGQIAVAFIVADDSGLTPQVLDQFCKSRIRMASYKRPDILIVDDIDTALGYIKRKYFEPITLKAVADVVYISPSHFSRIFKEQVGVTVVEYLTDYRLDKSKNLLKTTSLPMDAIAVRTGFTSSAYFARTFRRSEGITPSEYRNLFSNLRP